ncbi:MAG: hypothetical protein F6K28_37885 [Microcoleus sp. SIO2G3]|nr:hypothetical protein [Microcoleus sp. SIO2G3]
MQIGHFFSLGQGYVGQYLSPRVLRVRSPFRRTSLTGEANHCCFGFGSLRQAQKFLKSLLHLGLNVELRRSQLLPNWEYEVVIYESAGDRGQIDRTLAAWERQSVLRTAKLTVLSPQTEPAAA